jgi:hypothetical protein
MYSRASVGQEAPCHYNHDLESHKTEAQTQMTRPPSKILARQLQGNSLEGILLRTPDAREKESSRPRTPDGRDRPRCKNRANPGEAMKINDLLAPPRRKDSIGMALARPTDSIELSQRRPGPQSMSRADTAREQSSAAAVPRVADAGGADNEPSHCVFCCRHSGGRGDANRCRRIRRNHAAYRSSVQVELSL